MQQKSTSQLRHRSKFSQLILLNQQALIASSCDSIFTTIELQKKPVTSWFPFMESIYSNIWTITSEQPNISFNKVETPLPELPGIYDFTFSRTKLKGEEYLLWCIYDYTDLYEDLKQFQQRKNELEIHREGLERRYKILHDIEDIKIQQNIIIESLDHLQLTYFNKIKSALLAPVNALDGITFLLTRALENKDQQYTQQLRLVLKQLNLILNDLENASIEGLPDFKKQQFALPLLFTEITTLIQQKNEDVLVKFSKEENVPDIIIGNYLYLKQTLFGIIGNASQLHPKSRFEVHISIIQKTASHLRLKFSITEFLNNKTTILSEDDQTTMIYQLSIIKQLLDLQRGTIFVDRNPKDLSISICFDLEYEF